MPMKINIKKTKVMIVSKESKVAIVDIKLNIQTINQAQQYKYLRSTQINDGRYSVAIRHRIAMANRAFI